MKIKFKLFNSFISRANFFQHFEKTAKALFKYTTWKYQNQAYVFEYDGPRSEFFKHGEVMISILKEFKIKPTYYAEDHPAFQKAAWWMDLHQHYRNAGTVKHLMDMKNDHTLHEYLPDIRYIREFKCIKNDLPCIDKILKDTSEAKLSAEFSPEALHHARKIITNLDLTRHFLNPYRPLREYASFQYFEKKRTFHKDAFAH